MGDLPPCGECDGSGLVRVITQEPPDDNEDECRSCARSWRRRRIHLRWAIGDVFITLGYIIQGSE